MLAGLMKLAVSAFPLKSVLLRKLEFMIAAIVHVPQRILPLDHPLESLDLTDALANAEHHVKVRAADGELREERDGTAGHG